MKHDVKVRAVLVALLLTAAATVPAWSEDQTAEPAVQGQSGEGDGSAVVPGPAGEAAATTTSDAAATAPATSGEAAVTATPNAGDDAAAPVAPADAAVPSAPAAAGADAPAPPTAGEPPAGEPPADAAASGEPAADNSGYVERPYHPFDWLVFNPLWAATNFIGDFNPIGKNVSEPLEKLDPNLKFKGFIDNITQIRTTGNHANYGLGHRDLDWWLQSQEERIQTETKYQTDHWNFVNVLNFNWQGAYGLQNNAKGEFNSGGQDQVYYDQFKRIVREAYVQGDFGKLNFTIGKQILVWGKIDGKVDDFINAYDVRDAIVSNAVDLEWRTIGQWMAVATVKPVETTTVQLVFNPDFQNNALAAPGSPYYNPGSASIATAPAGYASFYLPESQRSGFKNLSDAEYGARVNSTFGSLTVAELYYHGFDRNRVLFTSDNQYHHTRNERFGLSADYSFNVLGQRFNIRSETLYTTKQAYEYANIPTYNHVEYRDTVYTGINFETSVGHDEDRYDLAYTFLWKNITRWDSRLGPNADRNYIIHNPSVTHSVHATNDKLVLVAGAYVSGGTQDNGMNLYTNATWRFNDFLTAKLQYDDYEGNNSDIHAANDYGAYYGEKHVTLDIKYEW
jgi:hypothetical protein